MKKGSTCSCWIQISNSIQRLIFFFYRDWQQDSYKKIINVGAEKLVFCLKVLNF